MKNIFLPEKIGRVEFLIFSLIAISVFSGCLLIEGGSILGFALIAPTYWVYGYARVSSWDGNTKLWVMIFIGLTITLSLGIIAQYKLNLEMPTGEDALLAKIGAKFEGKVYLPTPQGYVSDLLEVGISLLAIAHIYLQLKPAKISSRIGSFIKSQFAQRWELFCLKRKVKAQERLEVIKQLETKLQKKSK